MTSHKTPAKETTVGLMIHTLHFRLRSLHTSKVAHLPFLEREAASRINSTLDEMLSPLQGYP